MPSKTEIEPCKSSLGTRWLGWENGCVRVDERWLPHWTIQLQSKLIPISLTLGSLKTPHYRQPSSGQYSTSVPRSQTIWIGQDINILRHIDMTSAWSTSTQRQGLRIIIYLQIQTGWPHQDRNLRSRGLGRSSLTTLLTRSLRQDRTSPASHL